MEKNNQPKLPKWAKIILTISFIVYIWFFISSLILPLSEFIYIPEALLITFYEMLNFPLSILGFVVCVSIISCVLIILQFGKQTEPTESFLISGTSFMLYFIIPIIATLLLLLFMVLKVAGQVPTTSRISYFLEDLFIFTSLLFILTAILNFATKKILLMGKCCQAKSVKKKSV